MLTAFLEENVASIRELNCRLPLSLNGPEGSLAAKTVDSLKLLKWGLERMWRNLDPLSGIRQHKFTELHDTGCRKSSFSR